VPCTKVQSVGCLKSQKTAWITFIYTEVIFFTVVILIPFQQFSIIYFSNCSKILVKLLKEMLLIKISWRGKSIVMEWRLLGKIWGSEKCIILNIIYSWNFISIFICFGNIMFTKREEWAITASSFLSLSNINSHPNIISSSINICTKVCCLIIKPYPFSVVP